DRVEPRHLRQDLLQAPLQLERALRTLLLLEGMEVAKARQRDDALVHARVVLHRARPERVEAGVDPERPGGELAEVAHHLRLGQLRQPRRPLASKIVGDVSRREVVARKRRGPAPGTALLEDQLQEVTSTSASTSRSTSAGERRSVTQTSS